MGDCLQYEASQLGRVSLLSFVGW